jgi:POT family proton-dependent oligopeptide transporter
MRKDVFEPEEKRDWFGHPRGLSVLFHTEMWERFSYYGMRSLLVLYMVNELGFDDSARAYPIYGAYAAFVYAFPVLGGWVANKWLGYSRAIVLGGILMALGHFCLAIPHTIAFFLGMAFLCVGNGFFKPNLASSVGGLYEESDPRRDRGFTIYYMAVNIGALLSPLIVGELGQKQSWHLGFSLAGFGMLLGLVFYLRGYRRHIGDIGEPDDPELLRKNVFLGIGRFGLIAAGALVLVPTIALSLYHHQTATWVIQGTSLVVLLILVGMAVYAEPRQRLRMVVLLILMVFHMIFWAGFEQAASSFNVLADRHVDKHVLGFELSAAATQAINPAFIILLAPFFSMLWGFLQRKKTDPSIPAKFGLGLVQLGLGFWVLTVGISLSDEKGTVALVFLVLCYLLHTTGELCLSPIGLSAVTKLAPPRWVGFCMGAWFLTIANAHIFAAGIAALTGEGAEGELEGRAAVLRYSEVFHGVFLFVVVAGVVLLVLSPLIRRLIPDVR